MAPSADAKQPTFRIVADTDLRFGQFVVFSTGSRTVTATGTVRDNAIFPVPSAPTGPAQFTVVYDRGNEGRKSLDLEIGVALLNVSPVEVNGVKGVLSAFETDLPGYANIAPGDEIRISIKNCQVRLCAKSFRVGARLDVQKSSGSAVLRIALPMTATLFSVES